LLARTTAAGALFAIGAIRLEVRGNTALALTFAFVALVTWFVPLAFAAATDRIAPEPVGPVARTFVTVMNVGAVASAFLILTLMLRR
jgi:hypothetical protein